MMCDAFTTGYLRSSLLILKAQPCVLMELPSSTDLEYSGMSLKLTGGIIVIRPCFATESHIGLLMHWQGKPM